MSILIPLTRIAEVIGPVQRVLMLGSNALSTALVMDRVTFPSVTHVHVLDHAHNLRDWFIDQRRRDARLDNEYVLDAAARLKGMGARLHEYDLIVVDWRDSKRNLDEALTYISQIRVGCPVVVHDAEVASAWTLEVLSEGGGRRTFKQQVPWTTVCWRGNHAGLASIGQSEGTNWMGVSDG